MQQPPTHEDEQALPVPADPAWAALAAPLRVNTPPFICGRDRSSDPYSDSLRAAVSTCKVGLQLV